MKAFKNAMRTWRHTSTASAETDITNIMDTLSWRSGTGTSIWQTNEFIVSADQLLISWSNDAYSGVPIVVLPSVWLSIILRFTGRTDDDYKSFCLFLTQRYHTNTEDIIDPIQLLKTINGKTSQTTLKEQIIVEITRNKAQYSFKTVEDYNNSTERAFDKVLEEVYGDTEQQKAKIREEMQQQLDALKEATAGQITEAAAIQAATEREKTIVTLAKKKAANSVSPFRTIDSLSWILYFIAAILVGTALVSWIWEISPIYTLMLNLLPAKVIQSYESFLAVWGFFALVVTLMVAAAKN